MTAEAGALMTTVASPLSSGLVEMVTDWSRDKAMVTKIGGFSDSRTPSDLR